MNDEEKEAFKERRKATAKRHYLKCAFLSLIPRLLFNDCFFDTEIKKPYSRRQILSVGGKFHLPLCRNLLNCTLSAHVEIVSEVGWWTYRPRKMKLHVGLPGAPESQEDGVERN